jgi:integrase
MATVVIEKRKRQKRSSYIIYYKDPFTGERKYYRTFQRQLQAQQAANDLRALLDSGRLPDRRKNQLTPMTFAEVSEELRKVWLEKLRTRELSGKTVEDYIITLNIVKRTFTRRLLSQITEQELLSYRARVAAELSNTSSNRSLFIIKQVFRHGLVVRAIVHDPAKGIRSLKETERNRFLLPHQLDSLIQAAKQTKAKFYLSCLIFLGAEHGTSRQEALSLCWSDIDFDFNGIGLIRFLRTKNGRERTEYLMPKTKQALLQRQTHQNWMRHRKRIIPSESNLVFCHLNGTPLKRFDTAWRVACELTGIQDFRYHDLRHTFCSNLILSGAGLKDVKEMIGHSDIAMTDRYSHLTAQHKLLKQRLLAEHYRAGEHIGNTEAKNGVLEQKRAD